MVDNNQMIEFRGTDARALTVGERLRQRRESLGLSYRDIAAITKIQQNLLQQVSFPN